MYENNILLIGCSKKKDLSKTQARAIDLYTGAVFPDIRKYFRLSDDFLDCIFILSGKYGLISSKDFITAYDYKLDYNSALLQCETVFNKLQNIITGRKIQNILVIAEPDYFLLISKLFYLDTKPNIFWEPKMDCLSEWALSKIKSLFPFFQEK